MLRRRPLSDRRSQPADQIEDAAPTARADLLTTLGEEGWLVPRGALADRPAWTLVGTVGSPCATPVDASGLVSGEGWSIDWWIGAEDRWHFPTRSTAVRQAALGDSPVLETALRIPGGDALQRAYGIRSARPVGDEWVIVEVENRTPVPVSVALVVRPFVVDGVGEASTVSVVPVPGGRGRDQAHCVLVDGRPVLVLPRRPSRMAVGSRAEGDVVESVAEASAGSELLQATCPDGLATLALVFPLPHTALLRAAIPIGPTGDEPPAYPAVVPDAATVASGWEVHGRGARFEVPDRRLGQGLDRARLSLGLAHDGSAVRRDGHRAPDLEAGATETILGAFDVIGRPADVGTVLARWTDRLADPAPEVDALFLRAVSRHWLLHRVDALLDWMLPEVSAGVERLDRAHRRGRLGSAGARRRAAAALASTAVLLAAADQPAAAEQVADLGRRIGADLGPAAGATPAERLLATADDMASGSPDRATQGVTRLYEELASVSPTGAWPGPGRPGRPLGHDLAASAALILAIRAMLVVDRPQGLDLLPVLPETWYGGSIELHDAPTDHGRLSYAIRWHGTRPALLWELEPHDDRPVLLRVPGLDPDWSATEAKGEALLATVEPPAGLEQLSLVVEHPDVPIEMRRPGQEPDGPGLTDLDGGSFS